MNPLTNMKNVKKLSEQELHASFKTSWHDQYRSSAWIFVGGLPYDLTEGDIICVFSQYGEIVNINLVRDKDTGKSKGFCFICYEDQRSTDLAVDNFNGITILKRTIRVDHVTDYKMPKDGKKTDDTTKKLYEEGCAPKAVQVQSIEEEPADRLRETLADQIQPELKLPPRLPIFAIKQEKTDDEVKVKKEKKEKKKNKKKSKKKKAKKKSKSISSSSSSSSGSEDEEEIEKKTSNVKRKAKDREDRNKKGRHFSNNDKSRKRKHSEYSSESSSDKDIDRQKFRNKSPETHKRKRSRSRSVEKNKHRSRSRSVSNDRSRQKYKRSRSRDRTKRYNKDKYSRR